MSSKQVVRINKSSKLPEDFDWKTYVMLNEDLSGFNEVKAKRHYMLFGRNENRRYTVDAEPELTDLSYRILNEITSENYIYNDLWCHIHSNNPKELLSNETFLKLTKYFTIVITCDYDISKRMLSEFTILQIDCKHPTIDKKNYVLKYLKDTKYQHDLLLSVSY